MARINDGCADPFSTSSDRQELDHSANVRLLPVVVGSWPFLFVVTLQDIQPGNVDASDAQPYNVLQCVSW